MSSVRILFRENNYMNRLFSEVGQRLRLNVKGITGLSVETKNNNNLLSSLHCLVNNNCSVLKKIEIKLIRK